MEWRQPLRTAAQWVAMRSLLAVERLRSGVVYNPLDRRYKIDPHFCLGAPLARLEGQVALVAVLERFPTMRLATERLQWGDNLILRGLTALPVIL